MTTPRRSSSVPVAGFRSRLVVAMMVVVTVVTLLVLFFAERNLVTSVEREIHADFTGEIAAWNNVQEIRHAALIERCRALVRKPRIHAALEDNALDLLYPNAEDELRDLTAPVAGPAGPVLHAEFYRFLGPDGAVLRPGEVRSAGALGPAEEDQLSLPALPREPQRGYVRCRSPEGADEIAEIVAMPIFSFETGEVIAALVLGFRPVAFGSPRADGDFVRGIRLAGRWYPEPLAPAPRWGRGKDELIAGLAVAPSDSAVRREVAGAPHLVFSKLLNPGSAYAPAHEIALYPLAALADRRRALRWRTAGAGVLVLLAGLMVSHLLAARLSRPVETLAHVSAENAARRARAEAALESTSEELQRAARFSADASHQLMTPVTVLRAGLEELLTSDALTPAERNEIAALVHQTYRLSSVIKDLLLLSRMDAGRLRIEFKTVKLGDLIAAAMDDLSAVPESPDLRVETVVPPGLMVAGDRGYIGLILQNLLENARKYNRPGGLIRLAARESDGMVVLAVTNTGRPIPPGSQAHIFERFHRGAMGENVPGYGLGLNLARELARLHGGDLRLVRSDDAGTEFEIRLRSAATPAAREGQA